MEPEDSTRELRPLQAQGTKVIMVKGHIGQPLSAVQDQDLRESLLRDMLELLSGRTAT